MSSFENIKQVCVLLSRHHAPLFFAEKLGEEITGGARDEVGPFAENENDINEILKKTRLFGVQGPIKGGTYDKEGKWVEFTALAQTFNRDAPELKNLLNKANKCFEIEKKDEKLNVIKTSGEKSPDVIDIVNYFVSSDDTYALNLSTKKVMTFKARQKGSANKTDYGLIVELNIEAELNVHSIADKLIQLKLSEGESEMEKKVDKIANEVSDLIIKQGYNDLLNSKNIQEERNQAIEAFESFDSAIKQFIP